MENGDQIPIHGPKINDDSSGNPIEEDGDSHKTLNAAVESIEEAQEKQEPVKQNNEEVTEKGHELTNEGGEEENNGNIEDSEGIYKSSHTNEDSADEEHESDDEDDEAPKLKYTRLNQLPPNFFNKDPVSTCTFHESYFLFATHSGIVCITKPDFTVVRTFKAHRASVLCIYTDGVYFATASMDGTVVIGSIRDEKDIVAHDFQRPVHAIVLDRNYYRTRSFISGGMSGKVIYSTRSWLGKRSDIVLEQDMGPIVSIQLIDDLVLWMNDKGVTVCHLANRQIICVIDKPEDSPRSDLYWPRVAFPEIDRIIIGWGNYIWSLRVSLKTEEDGTIASSSMSKILPSTASISFRAVQEKKVEIEHIFKLDVLISGISSFKDDLWMVLTYEPPTTDEETGKREYPNPDIKLINSTNGEVEYEEELGLKNIAGLGLNDFLLGMHIETVPKYFIICARDGVIAEELQLSDRLAWFLEREKYYEAWEISEHLESPSRRMNFGIQYVDNLIKANNWQQAQEFLNKLLYIDLSDLHELDSKSIDAIENGVEKVHDKYVKEIIEQWITWSNIFIETGHIRELTEIIPTTAALNIPTEIYQRILEFWVIEDVTKFHELIEKWDMELYNFKNLQSKLEELLEQQSDNETLRRSLVDLCIKTDDNIRAVPHLIILKDANIIKFVSENQILSNFIENVPQMIQIRFDGAELNTLPINVLEKRLADVVDIFVEQRHDFPPHELIHLFKEHHMDFMNYFYLEKLNQVDEFATLQFGNERIKYYAQYNRSLLLPFLTKHSGYDIARAIELCESNDFTEELVYLLGKIGENRKALMLIINKLEDPIKAIAFAKNQNDREAWNILLDYSMEKPVFIKALIENSDERSNSFYDPITILKRMPKNVKVSGLNKSIIQFSNNNDLNLLLNQLILRIIWKQLEDVSRTYRERKLQGFEVEIDHVGMQELISSFETILMLRSANSLATEFRLEREIVGSTDVKVYTNHEDKLSHLRQIVDELSYA